MCGCHYVTVIANKRCTFALGHSGTSCRLSSLMKLIHFKITVVLIIETTKCLVWLTIQEKLSLQTPADKKFNNIFKILYFPIPIQKINGDQLMNFMYLKLQIKTYKPF